MIIQGPHLIFILVSM